MSVDANDEATPESICAEGEGSMDGMNRSYLPATWLIAYQRHNRRSVETASRLAKQKLTHSCS